MAEAVVIVEKKTEEKSGTGSKGPWTLMSISPGGHKYSWFTGQLTGEDLLKGGATVKITFTEKELTGDKGPYTARNLTKVEPADAIPEATTPSGNGHGERYTDADRAAFARKDEMMARCNATNNAAALASVYQQMGIEWDFWAMALQIEHYILTGEKPLIPPPGFVTADEIRGEGLLATGYVEHGALPAPNPARKPSLALLAECAQYVRDMQKYGVKNVVMPPPGSTESEVAEFAAGLRSRLAELKKNVDLGEPSA